MHINCFQLRSQASINWGTKIISTFLKNILRSCGLSQWKNIAEIHPKIHPEIHPEIHSKIQTLGIYHIIIAVNPS